MHDTADSSPVAIVGAGAVGTALARRLVACGYQVEAVLGRSADAAQTLASRVEAPVGDEAWEALPTDVRLVVACVPDDAITPVAEALAALDHPWAKTIVAHTSGARTAAALVPLSREGAATLSFHPLQTFAPNTPPDAFDGIAIGLEGDDRAMTAGETLARALGAHPVRLTAEDKRRYHCAAALASNDLVALMAVVEEVLGAANLEQNSGPSRAELVGPLVKQTWTNLQEGTPEEALTGPVARGDEETVRAHLEALADEVPHLIPLYVALSTESTWPSLPKWCGSQCVAEPWTRPRQSPFSHCSGGPRSPPPAATILLRPHFDF
jgi:predicted short-subunit dehydrogenase-like oxidoreductase (DUF2520 family)